MQPHNQFRFHSQVIQIGCYWGGGGHTDLYLLEGDALAIVDAGVYDTPSKYIAPALEPYGLKLSDIDIILSTHGHHDHTGGNGELVDASNAKVYVHEADARIAADPDYQFDFCFVQRHTLIGHPERLDAARAALKISAGRPTPVDVKLTDGQIVDLGKGIQLRVVSTPGHTMGSVCYYWEKEGMAFAGDSVPGFGSRPGGFPLICYPAELERSIARLLEMDIRSFALGHHYRTLTLPRDSIHFAANVNAYLKESSTISKMLGAALNKAAAERPDAEFFEVAQAATDLISKQVTITKNQDGLAHTGSVEVMYGYWRMLKSKGQAAVEGRCH